MKKAIAILLGMIMILACIGCQPKEEIDKNTYQEINVDMAKKLIDTTQDLVILDVSTKYDEGHLPNAINIYVAELESRIGELDKTKPVLVYCHFDSASIQGAEILINNGFEEVYRLEGNYQGWLDAGYELEGINITYMDVNSSEAKELIDTMKELIILDVSPKYEEGHLPNAINIYVGELEDHIDELDKSKPFLVYCHVDSASIQGSEILINNGFKKVYRLIDNYSGWYEAGYPIEISIYPLEGYEGSGEATRSFLDGEFIHTVKMNLRDPMEGKFYEGWLVKSPDFFSTGKLEKVDGQFVLTYTSDIDYRDFMTVTITEETEANGLDGIPEIHAIEGKFK